MESKDYERHSETITIPPAHVSIRRQNTDTAGGAGLETAARKRVVPTCLPLDHLPPSRWINL
jgi:hypothetical protein